MPYPVTDQHLGALLGESCTSGDSASLWLFVEQADLWVATYLVPACPAMTDDLRGMVTLYLAAHYATIAETGKGGELSSAQRGDIRESYTTIGTDSTNTTYLRTAAGFDPCGVLRGLLGNQLVAKFGAGYPNGGLYGRRWP